MNYPDDASGDALRRMEAKEDDLSRPRNIDFTVVFPDENAAKQFANHFRALGHTVSVEPAGTVPEFSRDVLVVKHMAPSYQEIAAFEASLQRVADTLGGHNDGWGCFSERSSSTSS